MENQLILQLMREYEKQFTLYKDIYETAEKMQCLCRDADFSEPTSITHLNELIVLRQKLMQDIEISRKAVSSLSADIQAHPGLTGINQTELSSPQTGILDKQIGLMKSLVEEITCLDAANQQLLQQKLLSLKQEAIKLEKGKNACRAYKATTEQHEGFFIDAKHF